jgi:hypothetical protein
MIQLSVKIWIPMKTSWAKTLSWKVFEICAWCFLNTQTDMSQVPTSDQVCRFQEHNVEQSIWDKVRCYSEHVGEQKRNLMRTHWELDGNNKNPKEKQIGPLGCMLAHLIVSQEYLCLPVFVTILGTMRT